MFQALYNRLRQKEYRFIYLIIIGFLLIIIGYECIITGLHSINLLNMDILHLLIQGDIFDSLTFILGGLFFVISGFLSIVTGFYSKGIIYKDLTRLIVSPEGIKVGPECIPRELSIFIKWDIVEKVGLLKVHSNNWSLGSSWQAGINFKDYNRVSEILREYYNRQIAPNFRLSIFYKLLKMTPYCVKLLDLSGGPESWFELLLDKSEKREKIYVSDAYEELLNSLESGNIESVLKRSRDKCGYDVIIPSTYYDGPAHRFVDKLNRCMGIYQKNRDLHNFESLEPQNKE